MILPMKLSYSLFLWCVILGDLGILNARPSYVQHMQHLHILHSAPKEQPVQTNPQSNSLATALNSPAMISANFDDENRSYLQTIQTAFTPLLAHYSFEKIIPADPQTTSLDEQLEYMHMISTFIARLGTKYDSLSEPVREFMTTPFALSQPLMQLITKMLVCLQSFCAERMEAYKAIKPVSALVKELKKCTLTAAKDIDQLCKKILKLPAHDI